MIPACLPPRAVTRPRVPLPSGACDTHAHAFGPADRFPYAMIAATRRRMRRWKNIWHAKLYGFPN